MRRYFYSFGGNTPFAGDTENFRNVFLSIWDPYCSNFVIKHPYYCKMSKNLEIDTKQTKFHLKILTFDVNYKNQF